MSGYWIKFQTCTHPPWLLLNLNVFWCSPCLETTKCYSIIPTCRGTLDLAENDSWLISVPLEQELLASFIIEYINIYQSYLYQPQVLGTKGKLCCTLMSLVNFLAAEPDASRCDSSGKKHTTQTYAFLWLRYLPVSAYAAASGMENFQEQYEEGIGGREGAKRAKVMHTHTCRSFLQNPADKFQPYASWIYLLRN